MPDAEAPAPTTAPSYRRRLRFAGPLATDAALAALAIEHGATLFTTDRDFLRFAGLKWKNPIASP